MNVNVLYLYYNILNLYGEYGNIIILVNELKNRGYTVTLDKKTVEDDIDFNKYNLVYIGCGTEKSLDYVLNDIKRYKVQISDAIERNIFFLCTGNSFEIFGKRIDRADGLGIFDYESIRLNKRIVSNIIYTPTTFQLYELNSIDSAEIVENTYRIKGFVNKMSEIYHNVHPLFKVIHGIGENKKNDFEGVKYRNFYGTQVLGPIFAKNPEFLNSYLQNLKSVI